MAPDDVAPTPDGTEEALDELSRRAGAGPGAEDPGPGMQKGTHEALAAARHHLDTAWASSGAGTEIPDAARLRQVKRAVNMGLRPITSHQVPFNRELAIALDRLIRVVDELVRTRDRGDERAQDVLARAVAGLATVEVGYAEVEDEVARLAQATEDLAARVQALEEGLAAERQAAAAARVREDVVLRAAREAVGADRTPPLAAAADDADAQVRRRLAAAGRPPAALLRAEAAAVVGRLAEAATGAPVLDLASGRGEWLDAWAAAGLPATGAEDDPDAATALATRGHEAVAAAPLAHLAAVPEGSRGAVTAAHLADVLALDELVALVDAAAVALRPGGALVLSVAHPASTASGSVLWADPRRRLVHRDLLVLLAFERGFAEAEVDVVEGDAGPEAHVLVARTPGGPPPA